MSSPRKSTHVTYDELRPGDPDWREAYANARLIAAAPRLLAALRDLIDGISNRQRAHDCPGFDCAICTPTSEMYEAEAAIAKATAPATERVSP